MCERPRLVVTLGDPSGIGPEIAIRLLAVPENREKAQIMLLASRSEVEHLCEEFAVEIPIANEPELGKVNLIPSEMQDHPVERGVCSLEGGRRVFSDLRAALDMYKHDAIDSILFMSLNKTALHLAGMHEEDELRWFAKELGYTGFTSELNFIPGLATSRVTSHCGIKDVASRINARATRDAIVLLDNVLRGTGISEPKIAVCALNPHGGENGQFGREEIDHIRPGVELANSRGVQAFGPFPADTTFLRARKGQYQGVVTMYHDQGQIALKTIGFDEGVTVQGGLPVPICTPAHGTAYEIVGKGIASLGPASRALDIACMLGAESRRRG